ncbi:MAG TPA: hypothetical protein PLW13_15775 [Pseudomonadales bacterium]|jgi:phage shock protein A|nr:hypothetical protein [Pseudomonadales bacterium]
MRILALLLAGVLLAACQATPPQAPAPAPAMPQAPDPDSVMLSQWLRDADSALQLSAREARAQLAAMQADSPTPAQRYRLALLHQQLGEWNSWALARDTMRALRADETLPPDVRRLAGLLEAFNQSRLNAQQQRTELRKSLAEQEALLVQRQAEVQALEEKIRSLTTLEDSMHQRREEQGGQR